MSKYELLMWAHLALIVVLILLTGYFFVSVDYQNFCRSFLATMASVVAMAFTSKYVESNEK